MTIQVNREARLEALQEQLAESVAALVTRDAESEYSQVAAALASPNEEGAWLGEILDANSGSSFAHI